MTVERTILLGLRYRTLSLIGGVLDRGTKMAAAPVDGGGGPRVPYRSADKCRDAIDRPDDDG